MEVGRVSQFEDQPVVADAVLEYTDALRDGSVPIVIDNGNSPLTGCLTVYYCQILTLFL